MNRRSKSFRNRGFSLPELLITMFIITSLVAGAVVGLRAVKAKGQVTRCMKDLHAISAAMTAFNDDIGFWPIDKDGIKDLYNSTNISSHYSGVEASLWRGPYLEMTLNSSGYPINPFGGIYYTRYACSGSACEYGVVITNVPIERAKDLDAKIDGRVDNASGNCRYQDPALNTYGTPAAGRTNVYVKFGEE